MKPFQNEQKADELKTVKAEGRLVSRRNIGCDTLLNIQARKGAIRVYIKESNLTSTGEKVLRRIELGDTIGVEGLDFQTSADRPSINCQRLYILNKGISQMPDRLENVFPIKTVRQLVDSKALDDIDIHIHPLYQQLSIISA